MAYYTGNLCEYPIHFGDNIVPSCLLDTQFKIPTCTGYESQAIKVKCARNVILLTVTTGF